MAADRPSAAKEREVAAIRYRELLIPLAYGERLRRIEQLLARFKGLLPPGPEARFQIAEKIKSQVDALASAVAADRLPDPARCHNPRCNEGWVERGDNESGGAPAFRCRTEGCPHAPVSAAVSPAEPPAPRTYSNTGDGIDPFGTHAVIPASIREARLATAPVVPCPSGNAEQDAWDRLHAFGFVRCPDA